VKISAARRSCRAAAFTSSFARLDADEKGDFFTTLKAGSRPGLDVPVLNSQIDFAGA
jgi:hypothetical protein